MTFPKSQRVVFQKNPLVEVICQLRFPTILEIVARDPAEFQNLIRSDYPLYQREDSPYPKEIASVLDEIGVVKTRDGPTHRFRTENGSRTVSLTRDFVAVSEVQYEQWEILEEAIAKAKAALEQVYSPTFYTRIGLRYRNTINRGQLGLLNEPWHTLISEELLGALGAREVRDQVQQIQTNALIRINEVPGGYVRLQHGLINLEEESNGQAYAIDADFFSGEKASGENVLAVLRVFNQLAGNLFRWAITARLNEALQPVRVPSQSG